MEPLPGSEGDSNLSPKIEAAESLPEQKLALLKQDQNADIAAGMSVTHPATPEEANREKVRVFCRWMIRRDMAEVFRIEQESFEFPWSDDDFTRCLRQRNGIGMVAEHEEQIAGFMIYELHKTMLHVLNFAVDPTFQRRGVGSQMVAKLISKLQAQRRTRILLEVRETNLGAQIFFRENGFRAVSILRKYYEDTPEDAYLMQCQHRDKTEDPSATKMQIAI